MPRARRRRVAGVLAVLVALLAGCATIPTSGPVVAGEAVGLSQAAPYVARIPDPPVPGLGEEELVQRFFDAMGSYQPGYRTASLYLSEGARNRWDPQAGGITVYDASLGVSVRVLRRGQVRVQLRRVATVDGDGLYSRESTPQPKKVDLGLVREGSQWRVAEPPAGLFMSEFDLRREFAPYNLYYASPDRHVLVPQPVFLPLRGALATLLVTALLRGVPPRLGGAVTSGIPAGTALVGSGVPVEDGTAQVALQVGPGQLSAAQRDLVSAQLVWTLGQIDVVTGVRVTLDGVVLTADGSTDGVQPTSAWRGYDPSGTADRVVRAIVSGRVVSPTQPGAPALPGPLGEAGAGLRSAAVDPAGTRVAGVSVDGRRLRLAPALTDPAGRDTLGTWTGADFSRPGWDRTGRLWVTDRGGPRAGVRVSTAAGLARVPVVTGTGPLRAVVDRVVLAADGVRMALLVRGTSGLRLYVGVVLDGGREVAPQVRIVSELRIDSALGRTPGVVDVGWAGPTDLAVLAPGGDVFLLSVDAASASIYGPAVPDATTLAAAPGQPVVLGTSAGRLRQLRQPQTWAPLGRGVVPSYGG